MPSACTYTGRPAAFAITWGDSALVVVFNKIITICCAIVLQCLGVRAPFMKLFLPNVLPTIMSYQHSANSCWDHHVSDVTTLVGQSATALQ